MERVRILIVDSDWHFLKRFTDSVAGVGHFVTSARSSSEALRLLSATDYDLLVVDLAMADEEIDAVVKGSRVRYSGIPFQIVMILSGDEDLGRVARFGADDIVAKSATSAELIVRVDSACIRLRSQRRLVEEREHYRKAVKDEVAVTTRVLDHNDELKRACRSLESIKAELERTNRRLQDLARYDMLSGLLNRVSLFSTMDVEIERARRRSAPLAGFMTDIDNFKNINDNWGHPYGDAVIRAIGDRLSRSLRKYDYAGRYGGEEFFIILPETGVDRAEMIAERFRTTLTASPVQCGDDAVHVTASIGVAQFKAGETRDSWITRADQAMYLAKQQGRNRTCVLA